MKKTKKYTRNTQDNNNEVSRKDAIKKISKYAALKSLKTFILLHPLKSQANSADNPEAPSGF
jgi:hypothetical protein